MCSLTFRSYSISKYACSSMLEMKNMYRYGPAGPDQDPLLSPSQSVIIEMPEEPVIFREDSQWLGVDSKQVYTQSHIDLESMSHRTRHHGAPYYNDGLSSEQQIPFLEVPKYDGKSSWEGFWMQFQVVSDRYNWGPTEQCDQLVMACKDDALLHISQLGPTRRKHICSLRDSLSRKFGETQLPEIYRAYHEHRKYAARVEVIMSL